MTANFRTDSCETEILPIEFKQQNTQYTNSPLGTLYIARNLGFISFFCLLTTNTAAKLCSEHILKAGILFAIN